MAAEAVRRPARPAVVWSVLVAALTVGSLVAAVALAPPSSADPERGLVWLLFVGSSAHVAATGWLYTVPEIRGHMREHRVRYVAAPVGLIGGAAVAAALLPARLDVWALLPYFAWQFFHFQKQNVGVAALAATGHRVRPAGGLERHALVVAGWAGIAGLVAHPHLLGLRVDSRVAAAFPVAGGVFAAAVLVGLVALLRRPVGARPPGYVLVYLSSLLFTVPVFLFDSPYAAVSGMTIGHGLQYLVIVGLVAAGEPARERRGVALLVLLNVALVGGAALNLASHLHAGSPAARALYGAYLGAAMAHFVVDAGLWRLRDAFPRAFLAARLPYLVSHASRPPRGPAILDAGRGPGDS